MTGDITYAAMQATERAEDHRMLHVMTPVVILIVLALAALYFWPLLRARIERNRSIDDFDRARRALDDKRGTR